MTSVVAAVYSDEPVTDGFRIARAGERPIIYIDRVGYVVDRAGSPPPRPNLLPLQTSHEEREQMVEGSKGDSIVARAFADLLLVLKTLDDYSREYDRMANLRDAAVSALRIHKVWDELPGDAFPGGKRGPNDAVWGSFVLQRSAILEGRLP